MWVYVLEISRLVTEAFPDYDNAAKNGKKLSHFLAGLDSPPPSPGIVRLWQRSLLRLVQPVCA